MRDIGKLRHAVLSPAIDAAGLPKPPQAKSRPTVRLICAASLFLSGGLLARASTELGPVATVSQKGRAFTPNFLSLKQGQSILIVNDDADLLHHAYIDSDTFSFDSGDQEPGTRVQIVFTATGDFKVLCGIHPKMKLSVHVE